MPQLSELLSRDRISLDITAADWRSAIEQAGSLLEHDNSIDSAYTRAMIESVEEKGPYIVVAPGFAFAHARPSEAVHRTAMSWIRLREPVEFGHKSNDPVSLVVALAAVDSNTHLEAMRELATLLASREHRTALDEAQTPDQVLSILDDSAAKLSAKKTTAATKASKPAETSPPPSEAGTQSDAAGTTRDKILTVCGNGLGTSLFLKNTLEQVLDAWGWGGYLTVEATDTISAKGKAKEADLILTSGEIARTLGDVGVPVKVIENFTSTNELDAALRELYDV